MTSNRTCDTCVHEDLDEHSAPCVGCKYVTRGSYSNWQPKRPASSEEALASEAAPLLYDALPPERRVHLPEGAIRNELPMAEGVLDYFPNALAEVARLSFKATQQHHPDAGMHWDRNKSTDHANKIVRHTIDRGKRDEHGERHSAMLAWRALANLQEELERDLGLPPSRASRNRPF